MKYIKMFGLLAVAAAALMAFAGTASATLTEAAGDPVDVGDTIHSSSEGATSLTGTITITCQKSTVSGEVKTISGTTASGPVNSLTFEECGNHTVTVNTPGELKIESTAKGLGNLISNKAEVTVVTHGGLIGTLHCIYITEEDSIGTVTGTGQKDNKTTGATLHINSTPIKRKTTDFGCGPESFWEGSYSVSTPQHLIID